MCTCSSLDLSIQAKKIGTKKFGGTVPLSRYAQYKVPESRIFTVDHAEGIPEVL